MTKTVRKMVADSNVVASTAPKTQATQAQLVEKLSIKLHTDEVWDVCFSNDGTRLASSGADKTTIIYHVDNFTVQYILSGHAEGIGFSAWSPDDSRIVTCSQDNTARIWDTTTGECLWALCSFDGPVTGCSWLPNGAHFVTTSLDKTMSLCLWSVDGKFIHNFKLDGRMVPLLGSIILPGMQRVASFDSQKNIYVHDLESQVLVCERSSESDLSSMCVSRLNKPYALLLSEDGLIEMVGATMMEMVKVFRLKSYGHFIIKATFGGENEEFVASGSEDGDIYVWATESGKLLAKQKIHTPPASCNSVAWNPKQHHMIATAGDDRTVRILTINNGA